MIYILRETWIYRGHDKVEAKMEVTAIFSWILGTGIGSLASLYRNRVNSDSFQALVQHPNVEQG